VVAGAKGGAEGLKLQHDGGVWSGLGFGKVPVTITVSLILFVGWSGTLLLSHYVIAGDGWLRPMLLPLMVIVAVVVTAVLVRPLAPVFAIKEGKSNRDYVGHTCTISTGSVDDGFGQATLEDGGTVLQIPVRCDGARRLARGDQALIIDFDNKRHAYIVEPYTGVIAQRPED
jgi:hypothetical protein